MKNTFTKILLILFLGLNLESYGTHIAGSNINYECLGNNQYLVRLTIYQGCVDPLIQEGVPTEISISNDCGIVGVTNMSLENTIFNQPILTSCFTTNCYSGIYPGVTLHQYEGIITLPGLCDSWKFGYSECCRDESDNIYQPFSSFFYVSTTLNNFDSECNNSSFSNHTGSYYVAVNQSITQNIGVYDPDGNTLLYSLVDAKVNESSIVVYNPPFFGANPIIGATIDSGGNLLFNSNMIGTYIVNVLVEEIDTLGVLVGSVIYDFKVVVIGALPNESPMPPISVTNYSGSPQLTLPNTIEGCQGENYCFELVFTDPNSTDSLFISSNINTYDSTATVTQLTWISPAIVQVCGRLPPNLLNAWHANFYVRDDHCPFNAIAGYPVFFKGFEATVVSNSGSAVICGNQTAQLNGSGGTNLIWSILPGGDPINVGANFSCDTCFVVAANPAITTTYILTTSDTHIGCKNSDSVTVFVVDDFTISSTQNTPTSCIGDVVYCNVLTNPSGSYQCNWSPSVYFNNSTIPNPTFNPQFGGSIPLIVEVINAQGCIKRDTLIQTTANNPDLELSVIPSDTSIICGDTVFFETSFTGGSPFSCGLSSDNVCLYPSQEFVVGSLDYLNGDLEWPAPFSNKERFSKQRYLFKGYELQAMGMQGGKITSISWFIDESTDTLVLHNYSIKLACSNMSHINSFNITNFETVFNPQTITIVPGWNTIEFSNYFNWNGTTGIVIELCHGSSTTIATINYHTPYSITPFISSSYIDDNTTNLCLPNQGIGNYQSKRPVTRFGNCQSILADNSYAFQWSPSWQVSNATIPEPFATPQVSTTYQLIGTYGFNSCKDTARVTVTVNCCEVPELSVTDVSCFGLLDGSVQIIPSSTTPPPYMIQILHSQSSVILHSDTNVIDTTLITGLPAGNYTLTFLDGSNCYQETSFVVNEPPIVPVNIVSDSIMCVGDSVLLIAQGGTIYNWSPSIHLTNSSNDSTWFFGSLSETITLTVYDTNNCSNSDSVLINVFDYPDLVVSNTVEICIGDSIQLFVSGGNNYIWSSNSAILNDSIANPIVFPTQSTHYTVTSTNGLTCTSSDSVLVIVNNLPVISVSDDKYICRGDTIELIADGGNQYSWSPAHLTSSPTSFSTQVFPDTLTIFTVTVTDTNFCVQIDSVRVDVFRISTLEDTAICLKDSLQFSVSGYLSTQYIWQPSDYLSNATVSNPVARPIETTLYTVTATDSIGCIDVESVIITVNELPVSYFNYNIEPGCDGLIVQFMDSSSFATNYYWDFGNGMSSILKNPQVVFTYNQEYSVDLQTETVFGCLDHYSQNLIVDGFDGYFTIRIPNVFTPNSDGSNESYFIEIPNELNECITFSIYNRWGQLVFNSFDNAISWDGKSSLGEPLPEGIYFYTFEIKDIKYSGTLQLFR